MPEENDPPSRHVIRFPPPLQSSLTISQNDLEQQQGPIELEWIDLNVEDNCKAHRTDEYDITERNYNAHLVLRRGQSFQVDLQFYRTFHERCDRVGFVFEIGDNPSDSKGTRIRLPLQGGVHERGWRVDSTELHGRRLRVTVTSAPNAIIGRWNLTVQSTHETENGVYSESDCPIKGLYLICNPWCPEDDVYMASEDQRDEYVLNDVGKIWRGTYNAVKACVWSYGQYEDDVLETCLYLLDKSQMRYSSRSSPIEIARIVSQMVNSVDDDGVLVGEWTESSFVNGTAPTRWTGSAAILRQWHQLRRPVRYAQCWVYAGVVTAVLRCLGIPSRVVTNFSSAHDTDSSCTVDIHYAEDGRLLKELNTDSIWNFHVWNDAWFKRPDLPPGYDGWQAIDATPQEKSESLYRVGPASVAAVKQGHIYYRYDTPFVFAEVNADKLFWIVDDRKRARLNEIRKNEIGREIITKRPGRQLLLGDDDRMDITSEYKHFEKTLEERQSVMNALLNGNAGILRAYQEVIDIPEGKSDDIHFDLDVRQKAEIGAVFVGTLWVTNQYKRRHGPDEDGERKVRVSLRANAQSYTGSQGKKIKTNVMEIMVRPEETKGVELRLSPHDYLDFVGDQATFMLTATAHVEQTNQMFVTSEDFRFKMPPVQIEVVGGAWSSRSPVTVHQETELRLSVANPLPGALTDCRFTIEGPGVVLMRELACVDAPPRGEAVAKVTIRPWKTGRRSIVATFASKQLNNVGGSLQLVIRE